MLAAQIATDLNFKAAQTASGELGPASRVYFALIRDLFFDPSGLNVAEISHSCRMTSLPRRFTCLLKSHWGDFRYTFDHCSVNLREKSLAPSGNLNVANQLVMKK